MRVNPSELPNVVKFLAVMALGAVAIVAMIPDGALGVVLVFTLGTAFVLAYEKGNMSQRTAKWFVRRLE